jgi:hypothetical protein
MKEAEQCEISGYQSGVGDGSNLLECYAVFW